MCVVATILVPFVGTEMSIRSFCTKTHMSSEYMIDVREPTDIVALAK